MTVCLFPVPGWGHGALHDRIRELTAALAERPDDPALHFALAEVYAEHGEAEPALAALAQVEALAPAGMFPTDLVRGQALLDNRQPEPARAVLDRFLAVQPEHPLALTLRARAHGALENVAASLADYRLAVASSEPEPGLAQEAADALAWHGHTDEALAILAAALDVLGPQPPLLLRALELELSTGRFDSALARVDGLQIFAPRPEPWMMRRAEILARAGRTDEARAAWSALRDHLAALPNLERGLPALRTLAAQADAALATFFVNQPNQLPVPQS